jgi:hypothetical protein
MVFDFLQSAAFIAKTLVVWYAKATVVTLAFGWLVIHVL